MQREADVSAQQPAAQADSRISGSDAHQERPCGHRTPSPEGSSPPSRLMSEAEDPARSFLPPHSARRASPRNERFRSEDRLRRRADFLRCYRTGRRRTGSLSILYFAPNTEGRPRLGVTASRKVGNSVVRHRLKRRIRETYRRWTGRGELPPLDLVVHLKPEAAKADPRAFIEDLVRLWRGTMPRGGSR